MVEADVEFETWRDRQPIDMDKHAPVPTPEQIEAEQRRQARLEKFSRIALDGGVPTFGGGAIRRKSAGNPGNHTEPNV